MSKESREIEKLNPDYEVGKKRKIVFWSLIASGIGVIVVIALLLIFLLPKDNKYEIDLGTNISEDLTDEDTLTGEGSYKKGESVTIVAEDIDGYRFTGWSYGGNIISTDKEYTFQIKEENEGEYTANYAKIYSVSTFDNNQYGSFTVAPTEAIAGETVTVRYEVNSENQDKYQLKRLYYVIAGDLQGTQTTIENNTFTMPEGNVTIYAEFNNLYNINLTTNIDEEVDLTGEGTYIENESVTISAPNVEGYRFRNWTYNGQAVTTQQEYTIANIDSTTSGTYIANYDRLYSITVNSSHGTVLIDGSKTDAIENENIEFTVLPNSDYRLIEVKVNNETLQAQDGKYSFTMAAENVTIDVTYSQLFDISVTSEHGTVTITDKKTQSIANENVSFTVQAESGYMIASVSINNGDVTYTSDENTYSFTMPAENVTIVVTYIQQLEVILESNIELADPSAMSGGGIEDINTTINLIIPLNPLGSDGNMYKLKGLKFNDNESIISIDESGIYTFTLSQETAGTYTAIYERAYQIDVEQNSNIKVTIDEDKMMAVEGEDVSFTVEVDPGYRLLSVEANQTTLEEKDGKYSFKMPAEDVTIDVIYSQLFDISVTSEHGTVTIIDNKTEAIANENVSFTITPEENYRIESVSINNGDITYTNEDNTYSFTMPAGDAEIVVTYKEEYAITIDPSASGVVTAVSQNNATSGEQIIVTAKTQDTVTDDYITLFSGLYYIANGSEEHVPISLTGGEYLFSMPANNVTVYVDINSYRRLDDFTFSWNSITDYTGSDTELTLPAYYDTVTVDSQDYVVEKDTGTRITTIGSNAFNNCTGLTSVTIPSGVTSIGDYAFDGCSSLTEITLPSSLTSIGNSAFSNCSSLATVTFAEGSQLESIGSWAFSNCSNLTEITLPASLTSIENAFSRCSNLATVTFAEGSQLESIGDSAFQYCSSLTEITLPSSLTSIGSYAFNNCTNLTEITLPASLTSIGNYAFSYCSSLATVTFAEDSQLESIGSNAFSGCRGLTEITLPASLTSIGDWAFSRCSNLATVTFAEGSQLESIGSWAFSYCSNLTEIHYQGTIVQWLNMTFGISWLPSNDNINLYINNELVDEITINADIPSYAFDGISSITKVTLGDGVTSIGDYAFSYCSNLTEITLPSSLTSIGDLAFSGCRGLTEIILPASLTSIGRSAFSGCSNITEITLPARVTSIGDSAFSRCSNLTEITLPTSVTSIGDDAFSYCSSLTEITLPSSLTSIGDDAFSSCSNLTEITLPSSLTSIGNSAFSNCSNLATVTFAEGSQLESIGSWAFLYCNNLTEIHYQGTMDQWLNITFGDHWTPSNNNINLYINNELVDEITVNTDIPSYAFYEIDSITKVTLGEGVTRIGDYAFYNCSNLTEITLPASVTSIGNHAFYNCSNLTEITLPASVTSIGEYAFYGCRGLTEITLPSSLTSIGDSAFSGCRGLTEIILPASLTSIGRSAFSGCYALALVINNSSTLTITKGETDNGYVGYYAKEVVNNGATAQGRIEIIDNVQYYINDTKGEFIALAPAISRNAINSISLADGTKEINQYAFSNCTNLTEITLPSSLKSIGDGTFSYCSSLATVTFAEGSQLESIGRSAFSYCTNLTEITLPASLKSIDYSAFKSCSNLATVTIESDDVYKVATSRTSAGYLLQNATTVRVPTSIVEANDNSYLEDTSKFTTSDESGKYTVFTKVS